MIALAKREEVIFRQDGSPEAIQPQSRAYAPAAPADEAHRFAIEYNRRRRGKKLTKSVLMILKASVRGAKAALESFGSVAALSRATAEEIAAVKGIGSKAAQGYTGHCILRMKYPDIQQII